MARFTKSEAAQAARILRAYNHTCAACGIYGIVDDDATDAMVLASARLADLQVDHVVPRSRGGSSDDENLQVLCHSCNHQKLDIVGVPRLAPRERGDYDDALRARGVWADMLAHGLMTGEYTRPCRKEG